MILPDAQPPKCPHCGKDEDIVSSCNHCGYVYPEEDSGPKWYEVLILLAIVWIVITVFIWVLNFSINSHDTGTLLSYFTDQYHFIIAASKHLF